MARTITVEPAELERAAGQIESGASDYKTTYIKLLEEVRGMSKAWQGSDNIAFTDQINGFEEDFASMVSLMEQYATFLRNSAKAYRETQSEIETQARRLRN